MPDWEPDSIYVIDAKDRRQIEAAVAAETAVAGPASAAVTPPPLLPFLTYIYGTLLDLEIYNIRVSSGIIF